MFSRGARDWLRHNEKVREAVKQRVREFITAPDVLTRAGGRTVLVPVRLLEHARFRLRDPETESGAGQGAGEPGQVVRPSQPQPGEDESEGRGGTGEGEVNFVLELKIDDILDWLWDEMKLPELKPKQSSAAEDAELVREGWDRRGARSRLDRRRTVKEAVKRRAIQEHPVPFTDDDLRFRQLVRRQKPATNAAVIFALDVSGSMGETERQLAKMFFFFALQGIRRQYPKVETAFLAHTANAWEFSEEEFFQTSGTGGTVASTVFNLGFEVLHGRYDPARYNAYVFYASDGENAAEDREHAATALRKLTPALNYLGYVEIRPSHGAASATEMSRILTELELEHDHSPIGIAQIASQEDVWVALRRFFQQQTGQAEAA
ncbi:MAG: hypothetical protein A3G24_22190 [Betaproteobacteria bacterium RIFCSPLOWO2_12_FULL_62_13]|nr:MAG: hypothetical protein A3G24_22190 [Betaproteobacteria bacterium RIFCSPLOWO2_12_FULL_62_13]